MQRHVWITKEFSVREETLCMRRKTAVPLGADWRTAKRVETGEVCTLGKGHRNKCVWTCDADIRLYSFKEGPPRD